MYWMTLTHGHGCGINEQKFDCFHDKVRTTLPIYTKPGSIIALVMVITRFYFGEVYINVILANFL